MKRTPITCIFLALSILLGTTLVACATRPAPDIKGRWQAVNRYAETTEAIPLHPPYVFCPSPLDGTLKAMLTRWARDSKRTLSYSHPSDFTLHVPVAQVHAADLQQAVRLLTEIYVEQRVLVVATEDQILVRAMDTATLGEQTTNATDASN